VPEDEVEVDYAFDIVDILEPNSECPSHIQANRSTPSLSRLSSEHPNDLTHYAISPK
jgi:hypothetical protein